MTEHMFAPGPAACNRSCTCKTGAKTSSNPAWNDVDLQNLLAGLLGAVIALIGVGLATSLDDRTDSLFRAIAIGTFVGTGIAYRRHQRRPDLDPFPVITRWSYVGLAGGLLFQAFDLVPSAL